MRPPYLSCNYFERNAARMRYPKFRKQGLFVGSGVIGNDAEELHQDGAERRDRGDEAAGAKNCLCSRCAAGFGQLIPKLLKIWSRGRELNSRPADYESAALPLSYLGPLK